VSLPGRPNEATGWVEADQFTYAKVDQRIEVNLTQSTLSFFVRDELVLTTEVAIGSPTNPTPPGEFFVTDIVELTDPSGPWGPFALGLSARSDTITEFNGGDGIIGIHGTNRPDRIGDPVSLGCVRVPNEIIAELAEMVQLGIPVVIE
jgi:lipoprotein-anchoring transpeptidase ErfK/SrfK